MLKRRLFTFLAAASLFAACSSSQSPETPPEEILGWSHSFDAAPADSAVVFGYDLSEDEARILRGLGAGEDASSTEAIIAMMVDGMFQEFNISSVEELGIDAAGDVSGFAWRDSMNLVVRTIDSELLVQRFVAEAPSHLEQRSIQVSGQSCHFVEESDVNIYACPLDDFTLFSFFPTQVADQQALITELLTGPLEGPFVNSQASRDAFAAQGVTGDPVAIWFSDVARLNATIETIADIENASEDLIGQDRELLGVEEGAAPSPLVGSANSSACREAAADIASRYRWFGGAMYRDDDQVVSESRLSMSSGQAENARQVLVGSPNSDNTVFENVIYGLSLGLDLRHLLDNLPTDGHLDDCENIAFFRGQMSQMNPEDMREMRRALALVSGSISVGIFNVDLQGMVPIVDGAIAIKTGQPERLAAQIEGELTESGDVSVQVVPDTQHPTSEFSSPALPMSLRMIQGADRIVLSTGNPPASAIQAMLASGETDEILRVHVNGDRAAALMNEVQQYLTDMGAGDPYGAGVAGGFFGMLNAMGAVRTTDASIEFSGNDLVIRSTQQRTEPSVEPAAE